MRKIQNELSSFKNMWESASGEYRRIEPSNFMDILTKFLTSENICSLVLGSTFPQDLRDKLPATVKVLADFASQDYRHKEAVQLCSKADASLTGVSGIISSTGTLIFAFNNQLDGLCCVLPPVHLVYALDPVQFNDVDSAFTEINSETTYSFISGPSRTADIEKTLVLGAHGPKRVVVFGR